MIARQLVVTIVLLVTTIDGATSDIERKVQSIDDEDDDDDVEMSLQFGASVRTLVDHVTNEATSFNSGFEWLVGGKSGRRLEMAIGLQEPLVDDFGNRPTCSDRLES